MTKTLKAVAFITNHFKEQPVRPKVVFANKYFLNILGYSLEEIANESPINLFANWNNDEFVGEIVECVDRKVSWQGILECKTKSGKISKKKFTITPVFNIHGEINYYSCSTVVASNSKICDSALDCVDEFIDTLSEIYKSYQDICVQDPANILKIDPKGNVKFVNTNCQKLFNINLGDNFFSVIDKKAATSIKNKKEIGQVSKSYFEINGSRSVDCQFWPIENEKNEITGYTLRLTDASKKRELAKELLALKGV